MTEPRMVTLTIDGSEVSVCEGTKVVDAAQTAGIDIPVFCHHPRLEPVGMCRMCLVEAGTPVVDRATGQLQLDDDGEPVIRMFPSLTAACTTTVSEGMVVRTDTETVADARRGVLEFLLTSHPLDCPICDKGGECPLQNQTMRYGPGTSRFEWGDKYRFPKPVPLGPVVALDRERCVLCARCIRFQDEIADDGVLGFENRGRGMEIVSFSDPPFRSVFSLNTTDICPVGALTSVDFRFQARAWELVGRPGVCTHCSVGCNVMYDTRHGAVKRVMPRENDAVNELWLCDKGRLAHHYAHTPERLTTPLMRREGELVPVSWDEALGEVAERLQAIREARGADAFGGIAGPSEPNEDLYMFGRFVRSVLGTNNVDHLHSVVRDDVLVRSGAGVAAGAHEEPVRLTDIGAGTVIMVVGLDVEEEAPVLFLNLRKAQRRGAQLVIVSGRPQKLDVRAEHTLRWRYSDEGTLLAALAGVALRSCEARDSGESSSEASPAPHDRRAALQAALHGAGNGAVEGQQPSSAAHIEAAGEVIAGAHDLLIVYGQEAADAGLVPMLAALSAALGPAGLAQNGLVAVGRHANTQGAADMGVLPEWLPGYRALADASNRAALAQEWPNAPPDGVGLDAHEMLGGGVRGLYVLGADPVGDDPRRARSLQDLELLIVQDLFLTPTARLADVVLPAQSALERDGTFTNLSRRVQLFDAAVTPVGEAQPGWRVLRDLGQRLGIAEAYRCAADVMDEIERVVPAYRGITHAALGAPPATTPTDVMLPFAPRTSARSVSYQGTAYVSARSEGVVWPAVREDEVVVDTTRGPDTGELGITDAGPSFDAAQAQDADGLVLVPAVRLFTARGWMRHTAVLAPLVDEPYVEMGPDDAGSLGLAHGDRVQITTPHGETSALLRLNGAVTAGVVQAPRGLAWKPTLSALLGGAQHVSVDVRAEGA